MLANFEIRKIESLQVGDIDVGRHHLAALSNLLGEPNGHGSPARADLKASPARLDQLPPPARERVEDLFQQTQSIVFGLLAPFRVEPVTRFETRTFRDPGYVLAFYHCATILSDFIGVNVRGNLGKGSPATNPEISLSQTSCARMPCGAAANGALEKG